MQRFGQPLDQACNGDLVAHLGHLTRTTVADPAAQLGVDVHHRLRPVVIGLIDRRT